MGLEKEDFLKKVQEAKQVLEDLEGSLRAESAVMQESEAEGDAIQEAAEEERAEEVSEESEESGEAAEAPVEEETPVEEEEEAVETEETAEAPAEVPEPIGDGIEATAASNLNVSVTVVQEEKKPMNEEWLKVHKQALEERKRKLQRQKKYSV